MQSFQPIDKQPCASLGSPLGASYLQCILSVLFVNKLYIKNPPLQPYSSQGKTIVPAVCLPADLPGNTLKTPLVCVFPAVFVQCFYVISLSHVMLCYQYKQQRIDIFI
jgi:hypothetical protein